MSHQQGTARVVDGDGEIVVGMQDIMEGLARLSAQIEQQQQRQQQQRPQRQPHGYDHDSRTTHIHMRAHPPDDSPRLPGQPSRSTPSTRTRRSRRHHRQDHHRHDRTDVRPQKSLRQPTHPHIPRMLVAPLDHTEHKESPVRGPSPATDSTTTTTTAATTTTNLNGFRPFRGAHATLCPVNEEEKKRSAERLRDRLFPNAGRTQQHHRTAETQVPSPADAWQEVFGDSDSEKTSRHTHKRAHRPHHPRDYAHPTDDVVRQAGAVARLQVERASQSGLPAALNPAHPLYDRYKHTMHAQVVGANERDIPVAHNANSTASTHRHPAHARYRVNGGRAGMGWWGGGSLCCSCCCGEQTDRRPHRNPQDPAQNLSQDAPCCSQCCCPCFSRDVTPEEARKRCRYTVYSVVCLLLLIAIFLVVFLVIYPRVGEVTGVSARVEYIGLSLFNTSSGIPASQMCQGYDSASVNTHLRVLMQVTNEHHIFTTVLETVEVTLTAGQSTVLLQGTADPEFNVGPDSTYSTHFLLQETRSAAAAEVCDLESSIAAQGYSSVDVSVVAKSFLSAGVENDWQTRQWSGSALVDSIRLINGTVVGTP